MKQITIEDIRAMKPCYDPVTYLSEDFSGTVLDILNKTEIPFKDRLWVICREEYLSAKLMRLFAVWCARQVQHLMSDARSIQALDVAERFAYGNATKSELTAAMDAARDAVRDAAWDGVRDAAWAAAWDRAWDAVRDAAWAAAEDVQYNKLREMIEAGIKTGDVF